ncbi:hypothetical protein [Homoserinimonas sp. OAct 916]|uniref:hypothetical protein n=1 Tax=Homoserinimonas sp. OAct 916 TaxID=2211450 RepID=UPI001300B97C|nr:hypothetical protein [Homoserinimonas sp. OAct 916]
MKCTHLSVAALLGLTLALTGCQAVAPGSQPAGSDDIATAASATTTASADIVLDLPLASNEVAVDPGKGTIWLATVQPVGKDTLWAVDMHTGDVRNFDLPDADYNGYTTHIRAGEDGAVWVSLPYELVRLDPETGKLTSVQFAEKVDGALPGALDAGSTLPGTWLSAVLPDEAGVLVARNNVPYLTQVNADMTVSRGADAGDGYAGAADLARGEDGTIYLLPPMDDPSGAVSILGGSTIPGTQDLAPQRLFVDGSTVSMLSADGTTTVISDTDHHAGAHELWTRTNAAGTQVQYDAAAGTLVRRAADGSQQELQLEHRTGVTSGGGIDPETGKQRVEDSTVTVPDRVTDFVVAEDGTVWFLRHDGTQLARWNP